MSGRSAGPPIIPSSLARNDWRYRAILATRGNQTMMGAVIIAIIGKASLHGPPRYARHAMITKDGVVAAGFQDRTGVKHELVGLGMVTELCQAMNLLADRIKATDAERETMFGELRKWIVRDDRAEPNALK